MNDRIQAIVLAAFLGFVPFTPPQATASTVVVPDDVSTVQDGINSLADTVLIRPGTYLERPVVDRSLVIRGIDDQRPRLNGLDVENTNFLNPSILDVSACAFSGTVQLRTVTSHPRNLDILFSDCTMDSGIVQVSNFDPQDIEHLSISRSRVRGPIQSSTYGVTLEADTLDGGVAFFTRHATIRGCWFRGGASRAIDLANLPDGSISSNRIETYDIGIYGEMESMVIDSNTVAGCNTGIYLVTADGTIRDNVIINSSTGIFGGTGTLAIEGNVITGSSMRGIHLLSVETRIERNVIGGSGRSGLFIDSADPSTIVGNTFYRNSDAGIDIANYVSGVIDIARNIGYENGSWGLKVPSGMPIDLSCNDWFNNTLGATSGAPPGATDMSVDPAFCDVDSGDVSLNADSPLVDVPGCGTIGARGVGCGVTATVLAMFQVEEEESANLLRWRFGSGGPQSCWVERSSSETEGWRAIPGSPSVRHELYEYRDTDVDPSRGYWYRIAWLEGAEAQFSAPIQTTGRAVRVTFAVTPNPSYGAVSIAWSQGSPGPIGVHIYDLSGREIAVVARGWFLAGRHSVQWDGRAASGMPAAPGWYGVRLIGSDFSATEMHLLVR